VIVEPIKLDAWFLGVDAMDNVRKLEAIQLAQRAVPFRFGSRSFPVTIMSMTERFRSVGEISYALELVPQIERSVSSGAHASPGASSALSSSLVTLANYPDPPA
jgi:hypothetical protein